MKYIKKYLFVIFLLLVFDFVWLTKIVSKSMNKVVKDIQGAEINVNSNGKYIAIIIIYLVMAYMIYNYNLPNIGDERPLYDSFMNGGLLGMMAYAIFDLTNYAIFNKWALKEAIIDILWGGFLFTMVGYIVHKFNF